MFFIFLLGCISLACAVPAPRDPMQNEGLYDGDMIIGDTDEDMDRNAVPKDSQRWPGGKVPFVISHAEGEHEKEVVKNIYLAMRLIMSKTCVRFSIRDNEHDYVKIFKGSGCYSSWGKKGGEQKLSLADGCGHVNTIMHELLHALGFEHEHNRPDRDDYLTIDWHAIDPHWYYAFRKLMPDETRLLTPFDYDSIMLYGSHNFVREYGMVGMTDKKGNLIPPSYDKEGMSVDDIRRVNILYECPDPYPK